MTHIHFDPYHLQPLASLNQRRISALPGVEPEIIGKTGYEAASKPAFIRLIQAQAQALRLAGDDPEAYPQRLNNLLQSFNGHLRIAAEEIASRHARRVGYLLASILLSPQGLTDPIDAWEAAYLGFWRSQVARIVLGGGLANARLAQTLCSEISGVLEKCGLHIQVHATAHASSLPLIGAARSLPTGEGSLAVVADFGGTHAKRGLALFNGAGSLLRLNVLPPHLTSSLNAPGKTAQLAARMVAILAETVQAAPQTESFIPTILCSAAAYVEGGKPLNVARGGYYALNQLSTDLLGWFSEQGSQACRREVRIEFLHDCDAAAVALAGSEKTAVLMLGSALGVGFVPPDANYRSLAPDLQISVLT